MSTEKDLVDELIEEGSAEDPEFPQLVEAAERAHSLVRMLATWLATVRGLIQRVAAISRSVWPRAIRN